MITKDEITSDIGVVDPGEAKDRGDQDRKEAEYFDKYYTDQSNRKAASKFYSINRTSKNRMMQIMLEDCRGKRFLEFGCGHGIFAFDMAKAGAESYGFDISEQAIVICNQKAHDRGLEINFTPMNAHSTEYQDDYFDIIGGGGILHHLDLKLAYSEIARIMKPAGMAVFIEPLGHNPVINAYRRRTPHMRTEDEHPLVLKDLRLARDYFNEVRVEYYSLWTLLSVPFRNLPLFNTLLSIGEWMDKATFAVLPFMKPLAWTCVVILKQPK